LQSRQYSEREEEEDMRIQNSQRGEDPKGTKREGRREDDVIFETTKEKV
jgi:hypothetical protein